MTLAGVTEIGSPGSEPPEVSSYFSGGQSQGLGYARDRDWKDRGERGGVNWRSTHHVPGGVLSNLHTYLVQRALKRKLLLE